VLFYKVNFFLRIFSLDFKIKFNKEHYKNENNLIHYYFISFTLFGIWIIEFKINDEM